MECLCLTLDPSFLLTQTLAGSGKDSESEPPIWKVWNEFPVYSFGPQPWEHAFTLSLSQVKNKQTGVWDSSSMAKVLPLHVRIPYGYRF